MRSKYNSEVLADRPAISGAVTIAGKFQKAWGSVHKPLNRCRSSLWGGGGARQMRENLPCPAPRPGADRVALTTCPKKIDLTVDGLLKPDFG